MALHEILGKTSKVAKLHAKPAYTRKRAPNKLLFLLCIVGQAHGHQGNEAEVQSQPTLSQEAQSYTAKRNLRKAARRAFRSARRCATYKGQTYQRRSPSPDGRSDNGHPRCAEQALQK